MELVLCSCLFGHICKHQPNAHVIAHLFSTIYTMFIGSRPLNQDLPYRYLKRRDLYGTWYIYRSIVSRKNSRVYYIPDGVLNIDSLWLFNIAMENHHFIATVGKPSINGPFSMAMLNNQISSDFFAKGCYWTRRGPEEHCLSDAAVGGRFLGYPGGNRAGREVLGGLRWWSFVDMVIWCTDYYVYVYIYIYIHMVFSNLLIRFMNHLTTLNF